MIRSSLTVVLAGVLAMGLAQPARAQAQDWLLVDANLISSETYLILTVPADDPAALSTLAAAISAQFGVPLAAEWPLASIDVHCLVLDASGQPDIDDLINRLEADDRIRTAQRIRDFDVSEVPYADPLFPLQWSLDHMNAAEAHLVSTGLGVKVGVVDSAIDSTHPDLTDSVIDTRDFVRKSPGSAAEAHGTAVAGIIAADSTNAMGMVGMAPAAKLVGLRACWQPAGQSGRCNSFSLARALNFAILNEFDVLNLSLGGPTDPLIEELLTTAIDAGIIVVAASGETDTLAFPASLPGVIAAGAAVSGRIPAPTEDVISTAPHNSFRYVDGSSIAAAHISGVAALLLAQQPDLSSTQITDALNAAVNLGDDVPIVDACKALKTIASAEIACAP